MLSSSSLSFIFVAGAAAALANQDLFAPSFPVVAYQVAAAADATTYLVACPSGSDSNTCNFAQPYTLVQGPKTVKFTMSIPTEGAATIGCDLDAKTSMSCVATGVAPNDPKSTVTATTVVSGVAAETHFRAISMVAETGDLFTYPVPSTTSTPTSTSHYSTAHNSTTAYPTTSFSNSTTSCLPTITSAPATTIASNQTTYPTGTPPATTSPTIPNAGMLSASSNLGGVIGVVIAVGAFFLAGAL